MAAAPGGGRVWPHAVPGLSRYDVGAKGATLHEALVRRYPGASFARDTPSSPHTACLPWTWHMYFAPVWWDETCAPLWRYRGQRWDPRSDAWLLHPWRRLVYLQDRQWEGPRGWGGLLGAGVGKRPLPPPLPPLTTIGQKLLGTVLASSPAVSQMFGGEWSASPARSWRQLPVPTSWGGDATPTPPPHTHNTAPPKAAVSLGGSH